VSRSFECRHSQCLVDHFKTGHQESNALDLGGAYLEMKGMLVLEDSLIFIVDVIA
jgi:hypothetical protein